MNPYTLAFVCTLLVVAFVGTVSLIGNHLETGPRQLVLPKFLGRTMEALSVVYFFLTAWTLQPDGTGLEWKVFGGLTIVCLISMFCCWEWEERFAKRRAAHI